MIRLVKSRDAWGSPAFSEILKAEIGQLDPGLLPLQQGLSASSYAVEDSIGMMVIGCSEKGGIIGIKAGIFYAGTIAGCNCADDPTPVDAQNEYCEVRIEIDREPASPCLKTRPDRIAIPVFFLHPGQRASADPGFPRKTGCWCCFPARPA